MSTNHEKKPSTEKIERKQQILRTTVIMGDSLVKNVHGWRVTKGCERNENGMALRKSLQWSHC